jgi:predicted nucleic acid-binding protein
MIVLDTNVISELGKQRPQPNVLAWVRRVDNSSFYLCSVVVMQQIYGAEKTLLKSGSDRFYRVLDNLMTG